MRGVCLHRHRHLGVHLRLAAVNLRRLVLEQSDRDHGVRLAVAVLHDRAGLLELGRELLVVGELPEEPADGVVHLLRVLELGQLSPTVSLAAPPRNPGAFHLTTTRDWVAAATTCPGWGGFSDDTMCLAGA